MSQAVGNPYAAPAAQLADAGQRRPVSKTALLLLTFFTGALGGHKFYLGKYWQGVLYLLFFWTFIPALVALIEFVVYAFTSSERLNEKYSSSSAGVAIAIIAAVAGGLPFLGILAAVALPAYQDYTIRARVSEALVSSGPWRAAVHEHYAATRKLPSSAAELGTNAPPAEAGSKYGRVSLGPNGVLTLTFSGQRPVEGKTLELKPEVAGDGLRWDCKGGSLEPRYRPRECRP